MRTKSQNIILILWILSFIILVMLIVTKNLSYEYYFVLSLICFMVLIELSGPFSVKPQWKARANMIMIIGVLVFGIIVAKKLIELSG